MRKRCAVNEGECSQSANAMLRVAFTLSPHPSECRFEPLGHNAPLQLVPVELVIVTAKAGVAGGLDVAQRIWARRDALQRPLQHHWQVLLDSTHISSTPRHAVVNHNLTSLSTRIL